MPFAFDEFVFDEVSSELRRGGVTLKADARVLELLAYLLLHADRLVTKEELIDNVWQSRALGDNVISVCVAKLRKVLGGGDKRVIGSVYGRGYRFLRPVRRIGAPVRASAAATAASSGSTGLPFVGRAAVLGRLHAALERTRAGRGTACALLGEAGIGKTRAAEVLEERAQREGFRVSWGRCHALGDAPPLWPWLQIVRSCDPQLPAELRSQALDEPLQASQGDAARDDAGQAGWESRATESWHRTLRWIGGVVASVTATQPWLIVLEDMQWADAASLQLLAHLLVEAASRPVLFLLTVRDTELPPEPRCRLALDYVLGHRDCERIVVPRLHADDVAAFTAQVFGDAHNALTDAVFAQSEGNPFFMVELLRPFVDGPAPAASELALPGPALDIVRRSLRQLDDDAREVLGAAAVIGRSFDLGLLAAVTGREGEAVLDTLEEPMNAHVIVAAPQSHTDFAFGHDLIRAALYDDLSSVTRVRLHQRVADALSQRPLGDAAARAELAHHLLSALPSGDVGRAVEHAQAAARAASRIGAYADASAFLRRALDALRLHPESSAERRCNVLFDLATSERATGDPAFVEHFAQAVELARRHGLGEILAAAGQAMSPAPGVVAMGAACEVLEAALKLLPENNLSARAIVLAHLSWTPPSCTHADRVASLLSEAEALARASGSDAAMRAVLHAKLYYAGGPDDHERASAIAAELERLSSSRGGLERGAWSIELRVARIVALLQRGQLTEVQRVVDDFGATANALHHSELIWHYERMRAVLQMNVGEFAEARAALTALKDRAERGQLHGRKTLEAIDWGELIRQTSDIRPFAAQLSAALRGDPGDAPTVHAYKLHALVQLGLLQEASAALQALPVSTLYDLPKSRDYLAILGHLSTTSAATRSVGHAAALYELLEPYPQLCVASLSLHCYGVVSHFLGILSRSLGRPEQARAHFERALADHERLGLRPHLARTRYELARVLIDDGDAGERKRARDLLVLTRDGAALLTMEPLRVAAAELLATVSS
ncbi:MAG: AAA family ATPase [Polyangiales bacterium]